jgi:hypothetical protein
MLVERGAPPVITIDATGALADRGWARTRIICSLLDDFGLVVDVP